MAAAGAGGPAGLGAVPVDGGQVAVFEFGSPDGPPTVLLGGLSDGLAPVTEPATQRMLREAPVPLGQRRCLALSYRTPLPDTVTTRELARDVAWALRQLEATSAVIVCHSMGGMVAQHLAADAPDVVRALVLSATVGRADAALREVLHRWDRWLCEGDVTAFARDAIETSFTGQERLRRRALLDDDPPAPIDAAALARHLALSRACATHDAADQLARVTVPTLVLGGMHDLLARPERVTELARDLRRSQLELHPTAGHAFPEQDPAWFDDLVGRFLAELPDETARSRGRVQRPPSER